MTSPMPRPGPDPLEKRWPPVLDVLPYATLAFCVMLSLALPKPGPKAEGIALVLSVLAAAWMLWMFTLHPAWRARPRVMALFITVLILLGALLVLDNTVFGLYTFTIYFYVIRFMVWPWRLLGAAGVGLLAATSQAYGVNKDTLSGVLIYLIIIAVNVAIGLAYTWSRWTNERALGELSEANRRLEATLAENAGLQQQLLTQAREAGVLDERQRMAREIHDTLAQGLTGIITQLQAAEQAADDPAGWRRHFEAATAAGPGEPVRGPPVGGGAAPRVAGDRPAERGAGRSRWPLVRPARDTGPGHDHRDGPADAARSRVRAAAHRAGGAGQRGQARLRDPGRGDLVLYGAGGRAGRARRRPGLRPGSALHRGRSGRDQRSRPGRPRQRSDRPGRPVGQ